MFSLKKPLLQKAHIAFTWGRHVAIVEFKIETLKVSDLQEADCSL